QPTPPSTVLLHPAITPEHSQTRIAARSSLKSRLTGDTTLDQHAITYYRNARALEDVALWAEQAITGPDREESLDILKGVLGPHGLAVFALS
ncbi:hypothetical protein EV643_1191, partial [Kribbella sp. VKM Ac-2527]